VEPFFSTKPRHRGIGLAIVCRTLFSHGGGFRLESAPGGGTTARTLLPVAGA
jgi:signal transduction histidine kinase